MDGIMRCTRYAFGPNRLHYCGPDANSEVLAYLAEGLADPGLERILRAFRTMYPYLELIAHSNGIADPFDERVVEAYWLGNDLLDSVGKQRLYRHLAETLDLKRQFGYRGFAEVEDKIAAGAVPHHNFHVLDVWKRTGHVARPHTLESLDACRISSGRVLEVDGPNILIEREPLISNGDRLAFGPAERRKVRRPLDSRSDIEQLEPGQIITVHWDVPCEAITPAQAANLRKYTAQHLALANQTA
jgi:hypothetical protein